MPGMNEGYSTVSTTSHKAKSGAGKQTQFEQVVLLLQGGGALGSYQAGVYQALAEAELHPDWVAGISIGAINSALIAGNSPAKRVDRLREFWEDVSTSPLGFPYFKAIELQNVGGSVPVTASIGVIVAAEKVYGSAEEILKAADDAMYKSKLKKNAVSLAARG